MNQRGDEGHHHGAEPVTCPVCHRPVPANHAGGLPRRYCSPEHRWLAASRRRAGIPPDREPYNIPRKTSRRPLPEFARYAGQTLDHAVARVERIITDERLPAHGVAVASALTMYVAHAEDVLARALHALERYHQEDDKP